MPTRWAMKSSGRNEDKGDFSHDGYGKEAVAGAAPIGGSAGQRQSKERKARTRRLIQAGAILEKVLPEVRTVELPALADYLMQKLPQHD